jgi:hypothetical protein
MQRYVELKARVFRTTAALVAIGMVVSAAAGGAYAAEAFTVGGAVAFVYQSLLNRSVDSLPLGDSNGAAQMPFGNAMGGNGATRIAALAAVMLTAVYAAQQWDSARFQLVCTC